MLDNNGKRCRFALVGRCLADNENLGLGYLQGALRQAGYRAERHHLNGASELSRVASSVLNERPDIVGLSLNDGSSSFLPLALGEMLRRRGFRGHITCGGGFATLARRWLLKRYPWLDSVVRFAGERPFREMARRFESDRSFEGIPGLTTRSGDGEPAPVLDDMPMKIRPARDALPEILGFPAAHMVATRGCKGRCSYCGPAALQRLELQEGRRAGAEANKLRQYGVGGVRRRDLDDLCDEMALLWHERGVRYFYFVDEHLLPYSEPEALDYLDSWRKGLDRRGVGPLGIGTMLRADRLTPAMVEPLAGLGLVRVFLGLEMTSQDQAARFARRAPGPGEAELLTALDRAGVAAVSNIMLLHPYSTPETIAQGIDFLERLPAGVFETNKMLVYHGTRLHQQIASEGRLEGNPFRYGYRFADPLLERFDRLFTRLRIEAFHNYSVAFRTHDNHLLLSLAARLYPEANLSEARQRLDWTRRLVNCLYIEAYRRALELARDGRGASPRCEPSRALLDEIHSRSRRLEEELDAIERSISLSLRRPVRRFSPTRAAAVGAASFCLMGSSLAACYSETTRDLYPTGPLPPFPANDATVETWDSGAEAIDPCTEEQARQEEEQIRALAAESSPCFIGDIVVSLDGATARYDGLGALQPDDRSAATRQLVDEQESLVNDALTGRQLSCLPDNKPNPANLYYVRSSATAATGDYDRLLSAIRDECTIPPPGRYSTELTITIDAQGRFAGVRTSLPPEEVPLETLDCVRAALEGLTFPCLAGFDLYYQEHIILE